jgi:hypothetical protein
VAQKTSAHFKRKYRLVPQGKIGITGGPSEIFAQSVPIFFAPPCISRAFANFSHPEILGLEVQKLFLMTPKNLPSTVRT